MAPQV
jgi:hypothetical protein